MKIAICHTDFRVYWPPRLAALAEFLIQNNSSLHVIEISGQGSPYSFAGQSSHSNFPCPWTCLFPDKSMEDIKPRVASARLYAELDSLDPDIVIAGAIAFPSGAAAVRWAREMKRPVVIMDNARLEDVERSSMVNWVKRRIYANVDALFIPAPSHVPDYKFWGIAEEQMFFGINAVDNEFFTEKSDAARNNTETVRQQYGLPEHFFLGVGRQILKKNWSVLIEAFSLIRAKDQWGLVLVGEGPEADALKNTALRHNTKVTFLPFQSQESLCEIYGVADCFVLPSFGETWGNVVNEAMACRLPVFVSNQCGCAKTLVREGYNGWQFDPHKTEELAQLMNRFANLTNEERKQMGSNSLALVSEWGLGRFCEGAWQAVQYCVKQSPRGYVSIIDKMIINLWKGRYRPV
jgi:glycosyltransferase involved in cell wall biosynthesis